MGFNDLSSQAPLIAAEWDYDKNQGRTPDQVTIGSRSTAHWKCSAHGHEWEAPIANRTRKKAPTGCPICSGKVVLAGFNDLASLFPAVAAEWDPDRNEDLTPGQVTPGSSRKVHWRCHQGHRWEAVISKRTQKNAHGCPFCSNQQVKAEYNDLESQDPAVAAEWDYERNGDLTPDQVGVGSNKKVHWLCAAYGHEWEAKISERTRGGTGCPVCSNNKVLAGFNDLLSQSPELAREWDFDRNGDLTPDHITAGSNKKVFWVCRNSGHSWSAEVAKRANGNGCPVCSGRTVRAGVNDLATTDPNVASQWDHAANYPLRPDEVTANSNKKVSWIGTCGHRWKAIVAGRTAGSGCAICANQQVEAGFNDLGTRRPDIAVEWDHDRNGDLTPEQVVPGSNKSVHWWCSKAGHQWEASIVSRTSMGTGCPFCSGRRAIAGVNDLASQCPEIAAEWDFTRNAPLTPRQVAARSDRTVFWLCPNGHSYQMRVEWRTKAVRPLGCHCEARVWSARRLQGFVADLIDHTGAMTPAMLYVVCQQAGVLQSSKADVISEVLSDPVVLKELIDQRRTQLEQDTPAIEEPEEPSDSSALPEDQSLVVLDPTGQIPSAAQIATATTGAAEDATHGEQSVDGTVSLPRLSVEDVLGVGDRFFASLDAEAADFLTAAAAAQIWRIAYRLDSASISDGERCRLQAELDKTIAPREGEYAERIRERFRSEYEQAIALAVPEDWSFRPAGARAITAPNLMQRHVAAQVLARKRVGNWSGPGAGKTVSAILAARLLEAGRGDGLVLVICPNNVVAGWTAAISNCNPHARIAAKTLTPVWGEGAGPRWLVLNFDRLPGHEGTIRELIADHRVDMLIIDEVHYVKERENVAPSLRRAVLTGIAVHAAQSNPNLAVLGMSATPVVNDLHEARSLLELIEGVKLEDLPTTKNVPNAMRIHQFLVRVGSRWIPDYAAHLEAITVPIDVSERLEQVLALGNTPTPAALDQLLLTDKLDVIVESCDRSRKSLIYTQFVTDVVEPLTDALEKAGLRVGLFTGHEKNGYHRFVGTWPNGDPVAAEDQVDVLIGSEAVATGVDGLQHVCDTLIFATLPWTHANFQQIVGRIHRQGQSAETVKVIIPTTFATLTTPEGEFQQWSWCAQRWARVEMKETLSDCAVDGVLPKGVLISPTQAARASVQWLRRLTESGPRSAAREPLDQLLGEDVDRLSTPAKLSRFSDLSMVHGAWASTNSTVTHSRLTDNPSEWQRYHDLYTQARRSWEIVPAYIFANWLDQRRRPCIVADLGCGQMLLADRITVDHTILPFDHVAFDERVTICDIAEVPLDDASVDIAVLCLALMGKNHLDYLREAHRILPVDGYLWLCEPTSSIGDDQHRLGNVLAEYGFDLHRMHIAGQFTFIRAIKSDRASGDTTAKIKLGSA
ncbi:zinc-ribbon domain-containing protein [Nocardia sp. NPDC051990]|uniref:zinc-ribbon domain-containing protein n=1 Tax=Nocardia sp. NPDC051990 TaxID=3155285 RepID=UPI0034167F2F